MFFVRSLEQNSCPCCSGLLKVIGSRKRSCIDGLGEKLLLVVRRLGCTECRRIHHELPDILVPYKRHVVESIEAVVSGDPGSVVADESTIKRWRTWFNEMADYFGGCLKSIMIRHGAEAVEDKSDLFKSRLQRIFKYTGDAPGWLKRTVQSIVNHNLWVHTRLAFCP